MTYKLKMENLNIHPRDTCFLMVSPDYSAIVTQHLSHSLTMDGEIFHIESVNVPFPDEAPEDYKSDFVSLYYDNTQEDLHFWWEQPNNHWKS